MTLDNSLPTKSKSTLITAGLALFSMFFGAGNLIFPLIIGKNVGSHVWFAILGLTLTAVLIPFLGLGTMILYQANTRRFFGALGAIPGAILFFILQLILGPLGVIPRLVTLMHATVTPYLPLPLSLFTLIIMAIILVCSISKQRVISFLGLYFTPILIFSLATLVFFGIKESSSLPPSTLSAGQSFLEGLLGGYHTMDLIAAFLFATLVLPHFHQELGAAAANRSLVLKKIMISSLIAASLLFLTYVGLCLTAAHQSHFLVSSPLPEQMLGVMAHHLLGPFGGALSALTILTACLTTAISLTSIFAEYLRKELCKEKISLNISLLATLALTAAIAHLGFSTIAAFLGPLLQILYPGLILFTFLSLIHILFNYHVTKISIFFTFFISALIYFIK